MTDGLDPPVDLARRLIERGRRVRYIARGRSMWPTILDGDRVTLGPRGGPARVGDIVFLPTDDFGLTHRIVARLGRWCCLKGDGNVRPDGWYTDEAFVARVVEVHRDGQRVALRGGLPPATAAWMQSAVRGVARLGERLKQRRA